MIRRLSAILALMVAVVSMPAAAQGFAPREKVFPYASGIWFDPAFSGSGWMTAWTEIPGIPSGRFGLLAFYTYDTAGRSTWLQYNQPYEIAPVGAFVRGSDIGSMRGVFFEYTGGPCPTCSFTPAVGQASALGEARLTWLSPTVFEAQYGGVTRRVRVAELAAGITSMETLLSGDWDGTVRDQFGEGQCSVRIAGAQRPARDNRFEPATANVRDVPAAEGQWFVVSDIDTNPGTCAPAGTFLQIVSGTDRVTQWTLNTGNAIFDPASPSTIVGFRISEGVIFRWYIQNPNRVVVHRVSNSVGASVIEQEIVFVKR